MNLHLKWAIAIVALFNLIRTSKSITPEDTERLKNILLQNRRISPESNELNRSMDKYNYQVHPKNKIKELKRVLQKMAYMTMDLNVTETVTPPGSYVAESCDWKARVENWCKISLGAVCGPGIQQVENKCECSSRPASEHLCHHIPKIKKVPLDCFIDCREADIVIFVIAVISFISLILILIGFAYHRSQLYCRDIAEPFELPPPYSMTGPHAIQYIDVTDNVETPA